MHLHIHTLEKTLYSGEAAEVIMQTESGEISVLPGHASLITSLKSGNIIVKTDKGKQSFPSNSGFAEIDGKKVVILAK